MSGICIRKASVPERELLEALQRRASLGNPGDRAMLLANPDLVSLPPGQIVDGRVMVAEHEGRILGFSVLLPRADGDFELDGLFVEPDCWRQGIGRLLVEHAAQEARAAGARTLHLIGNLHAKDFYLACGFRDTGTVRMQFDEAVRLERAL